MSRLITKPISARISIIGDHTFDPAGHLREKTRLLKIARVPHGEARRDYAGAHCCVYHLARPTNPS
jgi:hypothetical protein